MPTVYPGDYDDLTNPTATDQTTAPSHADQHADANDAIEAIQRRVGASGVAFPVGSPALGDRFYRTDRKIEYEYDGTRWLSVTLYHTDLPSLSNISVTSSGNAVGLWAGKYDLWMVDHITSTHVVTTNNGTNYWGVEAVLDRSGGLTPIGNFNTSADAPNTWVSRVTAINNLLSALATGVVRAWVGPIKVGTPGNLYVVSTLTYRLVG